MLDKLKEQFIVVPVKGVDLAAYADRDDLRELDGEFGAGVKALWVEDEQSIVAFLFSPGLFDQEKAEAWMRAVEAEGVNLDVRAALSLSGVTDGQAPPDFWQKLLEVLRRSVPAALFQKAVAYAGAFSSKNATAESEPIAVATVGGYRVAGVHDFPLADEDRAWAWNSAAQNAILDAGWAMYGQAHLAVDLEDGKLPERKEDYHLPVAELIDGKLHYVWRAVRAARGALAGARGGVNLPDNVKAAIMSGPIAGLYKKFGKEDLLSSRLVVLSLALSDATPPDELEDDEGLIWKEIMAAGTTFKPADGEPLTIEQAMVDATFESFQAGVLDAVPLTAEDHFYETGGVVPAGSTAGFVEKLKKVGGRLWAGLKVVDEAVREKLKGGLIKDVSVYIWPDFHDRRDGKKWPWVLMHLLLTNYPQLVGLAPFGAKPIGASAGGDTARAECTFYREVSMPTSDTGPVTALTEQDAAELEQYRGLGLTVEAIREMASQQQHVRQQARDLEIAAIVAALEGRAEYAGVVALDGHRHYPVVVEAAVNALRANGGDGLALEINAEGKSPLDAIVLAVVNAIPADGRMALETQPHLSKDSPPASDGRPSDEAIAELDGKIG